MISLVFVDKRYKHFVVGLMQQQQQPESALGKIPRSRSRVLGQLLEKVRPNIQERERSKSTGQVDKPLTTPQKPVPKKPFTSRFVSCKTLKLIFQKF